MCKSKQQIEAEANAAMAADAVVADLKDFISQATLVTFKCQCCKCDQNALYKLGDDYLCSIHFYQRKWNAHQ